MRRLVLSRVGTGAAGVVAVTAVLFWLVSAAPIDPVAAYLGAAAEWADPATRAAVADRVGADDPWWQHWTRWVGGVVTGDWGWSMSYRQPVAQVVTSRMGWTALLGVAAMVAASVTAAAAAVWAARRPGGRVDRVIGAAAGVAAGLPQFLTAVAAVGVFAVAWQIAPAGGVAPPGTSASAATVVSHLALPAGVVAVSVWPWLVLHLREAVVVQYQSPGVAGARARGVGEWRVLWRHVLPAAAMPAVVVVASRVPMVVTGAVVVEDVFSWPGLGQATVAAATGGDYPLLAAVTVAAGVVVIAANVCADVCQRALTVRGAAAVGR